MPLAKGKPGLECDKLSHIQHVKKAYAMDGGNPCKCHVLYKRESYNSAIKYHQEFFHVCR
jgi:hypothetical protein